jgi:hypothetical protein
MGENDWSYLYLHSPICLDGIHRESFTIKETGLQIDSKKTKYESLFFITKLENCLTVKMENFKYF